MRSTLAAASLLLLLLASSCDSQVSECVPGRQVECACPGGASGVQVCNDDETFDACRCDGDDVPVPAGPSSGPGGDSLSSAAVGPSSGAGAGSPTSTGTDGATSTGAGAGGSGAGVPGVVLSSGEEILVDVLTAPAGVFVVFPREVRRLDPASGAVTATWAIERDITAVAMAEDRLLVADAAVLHTLDLDLVESVAVDLAHRCYSLVAVSGGRAVCSPEDPWDAVYDTYDVVAGQLIARSDPYTYQGVWMRTIPGEDAFLTLSDGSPSDYHLYDVAAGGEVTYVNESPYHGDHWFGPVLAFEGRPATHVVTADAKRFRIRGEGCSPEVSSFDSGCFVEDGALGTLAAGELFLALAEGADAARELLALVELPSDDVGWFPCDHGCAVQSIDLDRKVVAAEVRLDHVFGALVAARSIPGRAALLVGHNTQPEYAGPLTGHEVVVVDF